MLQPYTPASSDSRIFRLAGGRLHFCLTFYFTCLVFRIFFLSFSCYLYFFSCGIYVYIECSIRNECFIVNEYDNLLMKTNKFVVNFFFQGKVVIFCFLFFTFIFFLIRLILQFVVKLFNAHRQISASRICRDYLFYKNRLLYQLPMCVFRPAMQSRWIVPVICKRSTL